MDIITCLLFLRRLAIFHLDISKWEDKLSSGQNIIKAAALKTFSITDSINNKNNIWSFNCLPPVSIPQLFSILDREEINIIY